MTQGSPWNAKTFRNLTVIDHGSEVELEDKELGWKYSITVFASALETADELEEIARWLRSRKGEGVNEHQQ